VRATARQISFADWELIRQGEQGVRLEPLLDAISDFLDEQRDIIERIRRDLVRGLKRPGSGRNGLTATQILRSLVLMRLKNWDYRELRERIADGLTLRQFTDFYCAPVPKHDAFQRGFIRLTPQTLKVVNDLLVRAAVELGLEDGVQRMTTRQRQAQQTGTYRVLIGIAEEVVGNARAGLEKTRTMRGKDMLADMAIEELRRRIEHFCGLGDRVIDQTRRRVLDGEQVPTGEKVYSIFEPHTDLIKRGKVRTPIEFGHKVFLAESARGLITQYEVLKGNPPDEVHVVSSLQCHRQAFGRAPELYGSDRGFFSEQNLASCKRAGVKLVCIPQRGGKRTPRREAYESSAAFKQGQRFRAGIEGRISVLFRGRGMKRCLAEGPDRFELWVGAAVLANNLMRIAALLIARSTRRRKAP